jgi:hypothetical protein
VTLNGASSAHFSIQGCETCHKSCGGENSLRGKNPSFRFGISSAL